MLDAFIRAIGEAITDVRHKMEESWFGREVTPESGPFPGRGADDPAAPPGYLRNLHDWMSPGDARGLGQDRPDPGQSPGHDIDR